MKKVYLVQHVDSLIIHGCFDEAGDAEKFVDGSKNFRITEVEAVQSKKVKSIDPVDRFDINSAADQIINGIQTIGQFDSWGDNAQEEILKRVGELEREKVQKGIEKQAVDFFIKKPPLGITPAFVLKERRILEISNAIIRYTNAGEKIPCEWVDELAELI